METRRKRCAGVSLGSARRERRPSGANGLRRGFYIREVWTAKSGF